MPFAKTWMGLKIIVLTGISQTEKDKYQMRSFIYGLLKKKEFIYKTQAYPQT